MKERIALLQKEIEKAEQVIEDKKTEVISMKGGIIELEIIINAQKIIEPKPIDELNEEE